MVRRISPSGLIQRYYRENRIGFCQNEILVGKFYLQLANCRIGLFFQSELIRASFFGSWFERYRFDVVSVMANVQRRISRDEQTFMLNHQQKQMLYRLKTISKQRNIILVYAGIKMVPSVNVIYWEKSFVMQGGSFVSQPRGLVGQRGYVSFVANIELALQRKWGEMMIAKEEQIEEEQLFISKLDMNAVLKERETVPVKENVYFPNKRLISEFVGLKQIIIYNLYYLYKTVNKRTPFVIPFPFSDRRKELFGFLMSLQQHSNLDVNKLVKIYRSKNQALRFNYSVSIYTGFREMLLQNKGQFSQLIYVYCEDSEQITKLRNNQQFGDRICNCESLIPVAGKEVRQHQIKVSSESMQLKKMENACVHVLKQRFRSMQQILAYFVDVNLNRKQIEKCFAYILPNKVKKYFKLTPHYLFLLHSKADEIITQIGQAEIRLKSKGKSKIIMEQPDGKMQQVPKRLSQKIDAARLYKSKQQQQLKCHRCDIRFKKDLVYACSSCKNVLCFDCIDVLTNHSLFEFHNYKCAICMGNCKCSKCVKVPVQVEKMPDQKEKQGHPIFNERTFHCGRCELQGVTYYLIRIQCSQCRNLRCYNCARMNKRFDVKKTNVWICNDCERFNEELMRKDSKSDVIEMDNSEVQAIEDMIIQESISGSLSPKRRTMQLLKQKINEAFQSIVLDNKASNSLKLPATAVVQNMSQKYIDIQKKTDKKREQIRNYQNNNVSKKPRKQKESKKDRKRSKKIQSSSSSSSSRSRSRSKSKPRQKGRKYSSSSSSSSSSPVNRNRAKKDYHKPQQNKSKPLWHKQKEVKNKSLDKRDDKDKDKEQAKYQGSVTPYQSIKSQRSGLIFPTNSLGPKEPYSQQSY